MDGTMGEFLYTGIKESHGDIISFLEDDDSFLPNKLQRIYDIIAKNFDIVYYHNEQIIVTEDGKTLKKKSSAITKEYSSDQLFTLDYTKYSIFMFNVSSITIRKDYYLKYLNVLKNLPNHPDDFFFFAALNEKTSIFIDQLPLTIYLRSNNSASIVKLPLNNDALLLNKYIERRLSIVSTFYESTKEMYRGFTNPKLLKIIEYRLYREYIEYCYYSNLKLRERNIKSYFKLIVGILHARSSLKKKLRFFTSSTLLFIFSINQFKSLTLERLLH